MTVITTTNYISSVVLVLAMCSSPISLQNEKIHAVYTSLDENPSISISPRIFGIPILLVELSLCNSG